MKKFLFILSCTTLSLCAAEIGIFPEKLIYPMAGFDKWQCGKDAITTVQTRGYSWSAAVPVKLDAAKVTAFNVELAADADFNSKLTIYFRKPGEKGFAKENFCRKNFKSVANTSQVVTIPMKNANWKDTVTAFRFDLSGKKGVTWKISRIWFTGEEGALLEPITTVPAKPKAKPKAPKAKTQNANLSSDVVIFPGKTKIFPQVGFKSFQQNETEIVAEHSAGYAYTAAIPAAISSEKYKFFNCLLESPTAVSGNLTFYHRYKSEKSFHARKYRRVPFSLSAGKAKIVSLPLNGAWKNIIDCFRFDLSAKPGQRWIIRKVWFSKKLPENFKNKDFEASLKLGPAPVELVEKRYDLLAGIEYRFALRANNAKSVKTTISFFDDTDNCIGGMATDKVSGEGIQEVLFSIPECTTYTKISVAASAEKSGIISDFQFGVTGRRTGDNW
ncbi:MAG: hypothetical protein J6Q81_04520, partial [Lentisphaeria bacterium]|nr:hypothetical protein [Lentisphaeria bacterium]